MKFQNIFTDGRLARFALIASVGLLPLSAIAQPAPLELAPHSGVGWERTSSRSYQDPLAAEATYENVNLGFPIELFIGYGEEPARLVESVLTSAESAGTVREIDGSEGRAYVVNEDGGELSLSYQSGTLSLLLRACGEAGECKIGDRERAVGALEALFESFDTARLLAAGSAEAEDRAESVALLDPEELRSVFPEELPGGWEMSGFSTDQMSSRHWAGVAYIREDRLLSLDISHYTPEGWEAARAEAAEDSADSHEFLGGRGFYGTVMGQKELLLFLGDDIVLRCVGPADARRDLLAAAVESIEIGTVLKLADSVEL